MDEKVSEGPTSPNKRKNLALAFNVFLYFLEFVNLNIFNLEISKNRGLSINPDVHHSKVPSSEYFNKICYHNAFFYIEFYNQRKLIKMAKSLI